MTNKVITVMGKDDFSLDVEFMNGEVKNYKMDYMLSRFPQFQTLKEDKKLFEAVKVDMGGYGVSWNDDLDVDAETLYEDGVLIEISEKAGMDINHMLAYRLSMARDAAGITQKELAEKTGIYQADISRIERGLANPSVSTLKRLADGLDMNLVIGFESKKDKAV